MMMMTIMMMMIIIMMMKMIIALTHSISNLKVFSIISSALVRTSAFRVSPGGISWTTILAIGWVFLLLS